MGWSKALLLVLILFFLGLLPTVAYAQDKSGVKPQVISLPSGPGSLEGLGEIFEPNLSTGTSSYPVKFAAAPGRLGFQPEFSLNYDGGNANGPWGMGWKMSIPYIQRRTENGLPSYNDSQDQFIYSSGEKLIPLSNGTYRFENESSFMRFRRIDGGGWEAHTPDGIRYVFGETDSGRVTIDQGIFRWELERVIDTHGNEMRYSYLHDGGYAYPREIRYNFGDKGVYNSTIFNYEPRPDTYTDRRSGAPIRVGLRGTDIQMWAVGKLVRAYKFVYEPERSTAKYSLLISVTQVGDDGVSTLPPHTFTYTQFDASAYTVITMQNPPPIGLINPDADLVDINADGLPDLVHTPQSGGHRFYLNRGHGRWDAEPILPVQSPPERLSNPNVRLADMDGDGRVDLLVKAGSTVGAPFYYYTNGTSGKWELGGRVDFGPAPTFNLNDPDVQLMDVNNDHRIDVVVTASGRMKIWLAREGAWSQSADFNVPAPAAGDAARFSDRNIKVGDMTGDRMEDLAYVRDGLVVYWPHNGNGRYDEGAITINPPTGVGSQDVQIQMGDLNNDGLVDLVLPGNRTVHYWLSLGDGSFTDAIVLQNTPAFSAQDTAVRLADMDGDGAVELLYSRYPAPVNEALQYVDFSTGSQPFLLASVDNGLGRTILIDYKSSVEDYIADWDASAPWQINLPFPVQVVRRVTVHDANSGDDYIIDYHYRDGYYDGMQKEFRGFARSQEIKRGDETAATTVTNLVYDVGKENESRKGLLLEKEILAEDGRCADDYAGCYQHMVNQLTTRHLFVEGEGKRVSYSYISQTDSYIHEQQTEPVQLRHTFAQDDYGNMTQEFNYGIVCGEDVTCGSDEILKYTEYIYQEDGWLMNRPKRIYQTDAADAFVNEMRLYYDGDAFIGLPLGQITHGNLSRQEANLGPNGGNRYVQTKRQQFDTHGNVIGVMDANGNLTTVEYDAQTHTFPVVERIHLENSRSLSYAATYHVGFGKVAGAVDFNGHAYTFVYDTFGRIASIVRPGDTLALPTQQFLYDLGSPRSSITTHQREQSGTSNVLTSVVYFDGLGRKLQTRSEAENGQVVVDGAVTFNARQREREQFLPYFATDFAYTLPDLSLAHMTQQYDPLERVIRTVNPDGSFTSVIHRPLMQLLYDEEDNRVGSPHFDTPKTLIYDGLERLVGVQETNIVNGAVERYNTGYVYDRLNNLIRITDAQGNVKTMQYDALSRKIYMDDPDRGEMHYTYDANGNLIETQDAKEQIIRYTYDAANRTRTEQWSRNDDTFETVFTWHYDADLSALHPDARNTLGQVTYIEDPDGAVYFSYDIHGNLNGRIRSFTAEGLSFSTRMTYDAMDRLVELIYPDGSLVTYEYNTQGLLERIPGFIENVNYNAVGQRLSIAYPNGTLTHYDYDIRQRLEHLQTTKGQQLLQDLTYQFDQANNIFAVVDGRPDRAAANDQAQSFTYDALYRLTKSVGTYGQIEHAYDAIGNMVSHTSTVADVRLNLGEMRYGENGAGPHALTFVADEAYTYDSNGNLIQKSDITYIWNPIDRLTGVNDNERTFTYDYDSGGHRIRQIIRHDDVVTTTLYSSEYAELRGDKLVLYVFADQKRVAQVTKPFQSIRLLNRFGDEQSAMNVPEGQAHWYLFDHLGSTSLMINEAGQITSEAVYYPYGLTRYERNGGFLEYRFTGKEMDANGLYYYGARFYNPYVGRFISADPLYATQPEKELDASQLLNLYSYGLNNPVQYIDPNGLQARRPSSSNYIRSQSAHIRNQVRQQIERETQRYEFRNQRSSKVSEGRITYMIYQLQRDTGLTGTSGPPTTSWQALGGSIEAILAVFTSPKELSGWESAINSKRMAEDFVRRAAFDLPPADYRLYVGLVPLSDFREIVAISEDPELIRGLSTKLDVKPLDEVYPELQSLFDEVHLNAYFPSSWQLEFQEKLLQQNLRQE